MCNKIEKFLKNIDRDFPIPILQKPDRSRNVDICNENVSCKKKGKK